MNLSESLEILLSLKKERRPKRFRKNVCLHCARNYSNAYALAIPESPYWKHNFCSWRCFRSALGITLQLKRRRKWRKHGRS